MNCAEQLAKGVTLWPGDCLEVLAVLPECSIDSCVTDPPYHLTSIVKRFGSEDAAPCKVGKTGAYARASSGFMGKQWDGGDIAFRPETWAAVYRVLKPGAHLIAFSGTRTYHRMVCAIEDAGFEVRDQIGWAFGSGFPKSHDISKAIDRAAGAEREVVGLKDNKGRAAGSIACIGLNIDSAGDPITAPATDAAREWEGWGSALKPSHEPVCIAQKPSNNGHLITTIGSHINQLWGCLWSMLSAKDAAAFSGLSPSGCGAGDVRASAQWSAADASNTRADLSAQMDTPQFELALISSLNTVSSWSGIWDAASVGGSTSITATESKTTIDLRTLNSCLSKITPGSIILAHRSGAWSNANASPAESYFNATAVTLLSILELSVAGRALSKDATCFPVEIGEIKPNWNSVVVVRKPLSEPTIAANVLKWGTGALNIDGCRVAAEPRPHIERRNDKALDGDVYGSGINGSRSLGTTTSARWPANLIHDGSEEVVGAFPETGISAGGNSTSTGNPTVKLLAGVDESRRGVPCGFGDSGSAARFFYAAKADGDDRLGSKHPTVKPVDLIQYLVRLVTPKGGTALDPFAGTGTLGEACIREGMKAVLIEREAEYQEDIRRRMKLAMAGPDERGRETARAKNPTPDHGPLFSYADDYDAGKDLGGSIAEGFRVIRERVADGGPGWEPK